MGAAACQAAAAGKSIVSHGRGTQWSLKVEPGDYCLTMLKAANQKEDVSFTLTVKRP